MFVSKKKYDALAGDVEYYHNRVDQLNEYLEAAYQEIADLKASRARSNENLKLGTAASAKARRTRKILSSDAHHVPNA